MNQKTAKLIRKKVAETHGIDPLVEIEGVQRKNPQYRRICNMVKRELNSTPRNKRAEYKKNGI